MRPDGSVTRYHHVKWTELSGEPCACRREGATACSIHELKDAFGKVHTGRGRLSPARLLRFRSSLGHLRCISRLSGNRGRRATTDCCKCTRPHVKHDVCKCLSQRNGNCDCIETRSIFRKQTVARIRFYHETFAVEPLFIRNHRHVAAMLLHKMLGVLRPANRSHRLNGRDVLRDNKHSPLCHALSNRFRQGRTLLVIILMIRERDAPPLSRTAHTPAPSHLIR